jgi:hypothetical protein
MENFIGSGPYWRPGDGKRVVLDRVAKQNRRAPFGARRFVILAL